jgi:ABC-type phosphate transport system substrate-binding protein
LSSLLRRFAAPIALLLTLSLVAAACGGGDDSATGTETPGGDGAAAELPECLAFEDIYALVGPESTGFSDWSDANDLAAEIGAPNAPYPDLPLDVFGPGEESGTFDSFVELVLEDLAEERGQEDPSPRPDYQSSPNDNVIVEGISGSTSSFGWVGYAFYVENQDALRAFRIDGGDGCVEPTDETIASGEYAISRPLFIYVNKAKAEESPALAAFVDYYLSDDGLAAVGDAGYVALDAGALEETRAEWEASGLAGAGAEELSGSIEVSGSSTVEPITARVAEAFNAQGSGVDISVEGPGTGDGFERFCAGETDVSDASRAISEEEQKRCTDAGVEWIELQVAIDGLTVMTSA